MGIIDYSLRRRVRAIEQALELDPNAASDPNAPALLGGHGSPEGIEVAGPGSLYRDRDSGLFWLKAVGTGATGWVRGVPAGTQRVDTFGVKGDGSDETTAIRAAIDTAVALSPQGTVIFGTGTFGYTQLPITSGSVRLVGDGPERSILKPVASAVGPTVNADFAAFTANFRMEGLSIDMANAPTLDALYVSNVNKFYVNDVKIRQGRRQVWLGNVSAAVIGEIWGMNPKSAVLYVHAPNPATAANPTGQQPNVEIDTLHFEATGVNNGVAADAAVWIDGFTAGVTIQNLWAIKSIAAGTGTLGAGLRIDGPEEPSGTLGHFVLCSNINTDGIDGPGVRLNNARQFQVVNSFLGTKPGSAGGTAGGIRVQGTCQDIMVFDDWISGVGIDIDAAATLNGLQVDGCKFPQTVAGGAFAVPAGATLTDVKIGENVYATAMTVDEASMARLLAAMPTTSAKRGAISPPRIMLSAASASRRVEYHNPVAGQSWWNDVTDTGAGYRFLDNAQRVIFALVNGGGIQVGDQSAGQPTAATIKRIATATAAYAGNATLAAGARDTVVVTFANATILTSDHLEASSSGPMPNGVHLKAERASATTVNVYVENVGSASANVGACTLRAMLYQF